MENTHTITVYKLRYNIGSRDERWESDLYLNKELFVAHINEIISKRKEYEATHDLTWLDDCDFVNEFYTIEDLEKGNYLVYQSQNGCIKCEVLTLDVIN